MNIINSSQIKFTNSKKQKKYTPYFLTLNIFSTTVKNCEKVLERFLFSSKVVPSILIPILLYYNCTF